MSVPPPLHSPLLPAPTEMEEAALAWFTRCERGLTEMQEMAFQDWLAADARHAALFNELDGTWALLERAGGEVAAAPGSARPRWPTWFIRAALPLAVAAALVVGYVTWWRPAHYAGETITAIGDLQTLQLPDGSQVTLNTDSVVSAAFTPGERRIRLVRGEAHFVVAKNPRRPFIVEVGGVSVRAVGTAFNVRLDERAVEVLVTEGKVRVDDSASGQSLLAPPSGLTAEALTALGQPVLATGQRAVVARPTAVGAGTPPRPPVAVAASVSTEEIQRELAWQERRLEFELASLGDIAAEFNRYSPHQLVIADDNLARQRFGGSFKPDDQAGFVRMLRENFGVQVEETERATVLRSGR